MSSTTPSTQAGARTTTALLPTLGLGGGPRGGNGNEGSGAAFSDLLRDKIAAPKPEAAKPASPAPAPAPTAQTRKAESRQDGQPRTNESADSDATAESATAVAQEAGSTETQTDPRTRRSGKSAAGQTSKPGSDAAKTPLQTPGEPATESCATDESATAEAGEDLPLDDSSNPDVSMAQAILQMLNSPLPAQAKAVATESAATAQADSGTPGAIAETLQAGTPTLQTTAQPAGQSETAAAQGREASAATASALQLGDSANEQALLAAGEAHLTRSAEALAPQGPAAGPGSFAAHLQALSNPRSAQAAGSSAPSSVALAQPLHSPEFAPAMSARLALLAAEGVQQAQLQLNPAEMGPVSVQITVEGQQAQIAFHAVQADTRQVLEQSLPELAAALRDQGLTLSGGGVFEQSQQQAREQAQQAASGSRLNGQSGLTSDTELLSAQAAAQRPPAAPSRGVLDLYA